MRWRRHVCPGVGVGDGWWASSDEFRSVGRHCESLDEFGGVIDGWERGDLVGNLTSAVSVLSVVEKPSKRLSDILGGPLVLAEGKSCAELHQLRGVEPVVWWSERQAQNRYSSFQCARERAVAAVCDDEVGVFEDESLREERDRSYVSWDLEVAGFVVHPDRGDDSDVEVGDGIEDQLEQIWRVERRSERHVHQRPFVLAVQYRRDRLARCRLGFHRLHEMCVRGETVTIEPARWCPDDGELVLRRSGSGSGDKPTSCRNQVISPDATSSSIPDCAGAKSKVASGVSVCSAIAEASSPAVSVKIASGSHSSHNMRMNGTAAAARRKNGRNISAPSDSGSGRRSSSDVMSAGSTTSVGKPSPAANSDGAIAPDPREFPDINRSRALTT